MCLAAVAASCLVTPKDYPLDESLGQAGSGGASHTGGSSSGAGGSGNGGSGNGGSGTGGRGGTGASSNQGGSAGKGGMPSGGAGVGGSSSGTAGSGAGAGGEPQIGQPCTNASECDDSNACTTDICVEEICQNEPVALRSKPWSATASVSFSGATGCAVPVQEASAAVDGNLASRWSTGEEQSGDEWLQVDLGGSEVINRITLDTHDVSNTCGSGTDYPRHYRVRFSDIPNDLAAPIVVEGDGVLDLVVIQFPEPVAGRFLLIEQTGVVSPNWWSVAELDAACE